MGIVVNNHKGFLPTDRAAAEQIASEKLGAAANLYQAGSLMDEAGRAYWAGETEVFTTSVRASQDLLAQAQERLRDVIQNELDLNPRIAASEKEAKCVELGLDQDGNTAGEMTARSVQGAQRLVAGITHLLTLRSLIDQAAEEVDLEKVYALWSAPFRHLLVEVSQFMISAIEDARLTHEMASVVEDVWVSEGRRENKTAHLTGEPIFTEIRH